MTAESKAYETTLRNFFLGLSIGVLLATILKPRPRSLGLARDIVDIAVGRLVPGKRCAGVLVQRFSTLR